MSRAPQQKLKANDLKQEDTDIDTIQKRESIQNCIKSFGATYPSEIAWETGFSDYTIKIILKLMEADKEVERISVNPHNPDKRLLARVPEMSARGEGGYDAFSRKRWYGRIK